MNYTVCFFLVTMTSTGCVLGMQQHAKTAVGKYAAIAVNEAVPPGYRRVVIRFDGDIICVVDLKKEESPVVVPTILPAKGPAPAFTQPSRVPEGIPCRVPAQQPCVQESAGYAVDYSSDESSDGSGSQEERDWQSYRDYCLDHPHERE